MEKMVPSPATLALEAPDVLDGPFASIRASRDRKYHGAYTASRRRLQDSLIQSFLDPGAATHPNSPAEAPPPAPTSEPWILFTCGPMGAGKSHVVAWLSRERGLPICDFVHIDADAFRERLPEWGGYLQRDPDTAGRMTHRECGYLVEVAQEAALEGGRCVWVDSSMRDREWFGGVVQHIRARHPRHRIAILYVTASRAAILGRAREREARTGRRVPCCEILDSLWRVPGTFAALASEADLVGVATNEPGAPPVLKCASFPRSGCELYRRPQGPGGGGVPWSVFTGALAQGPVPRGAAHPSKGPPRPARFHRRQSCAYQGGMPLRRAFGGEQAGAIPGEVVGGRGGRRSSFSLPRDDGWGA